MLDGLLDDMRYVPGAFDDDAVYAELDRTLREFDERAGEPLNRVFYLSTAPQFFPVIAGKLGAAGLNRAPRRGDADRDREAVRLRPRLGARAQRRRCSSVFDESQVFRIDHYLGKETVQNLMALRFANALFEPVWNRNFIDHVQITAAEDIGIEGRAGYYEGAGALRDLVQNHMMQLLALLTMEPPTAFDADRVRDEKLKVLEAIVPPDVAEVAVDGGPGPVRPRSRRRRSGCPATTRRRASRPTRGPRPTPRCACTCRTGAGRACRSTCGPASGWPARSPRSR